jgi:hypothetical protein
MTSQTRRRPEGCASDLELEELIAGELTGGSEARLRDHVAGCARCQARRASLAAEPVLKPDPEAWRKLAGEQRGAGRPRRGGVGRRIGAAAGVMVAAAAILLTWNLGRPPSPDPDVGGHRVKGTLALSIDVKRGDGRIDRISGDGVLHAGDEMRFAVTATAGGHAVVLGLDAAPAVTVYASGAEVAAGTPVVLAGSIVADATAGFERVFAIACPAAQSPETLRQLAGTALTAAGGRPEAVSSLGTSVMGCAEAFVTLRKQAGQ